MKRSLWLGLLAAGLISQASVVGAQDASDDSSEFDGVEELEEEIDVNDLIGTFWELGAEQKRGVYELRTYRPNFILPVHHSSDINKQPSSPTRGDSERIENYKPNEVKLQLSLRTKIFEDIFLPNGDIWVAYSQTSLWQMYNSDDSSPFRSTDYNPDIFYVLPVTEEFDFLPGKARVRMGKFGFAHQSNGQRKPDSRSWNYFHFGGVAEYDDVIWESSYKLRVNETGDDDDNPDLVNYRGNFENTFSWINGTSTYSLKRTSPYLSLSRGSWQIDYTRPVSQSKPDGLRFYIQIFSGYGESLLDYNHRQNRIGFGFLLLNI